MVIRTVQFLAIIVSALTLIPAGAHLAALPNKIDLPQAEYFTVQESTEDGPLSGRYGHLR